MYMSYRKKPRIKKGRVIAMLQAYKLELPTKWKIHNVFYISLLEQDITRKRQVNQNNTHVLLELEREFEAGNNKKYKVESIIDSVIYGKKAKN